MDQKRISNPSASINNSNYKALHDQSRISILSSNYIRNSKSKHSIANSINTSTNVTKMSHMGMHQKSSSPQDLKNIERVINHDKESR
jgi:hypothetical protein